MSNPKTNRHTAGELLKEPVADPHVVYVRTRIDELPITLAQLALDAGLSVSVLAEAILCRQIGIEHPHADTARRAIIRRTTRQRPDTLPLEG